MVLQCVNDYKILSLLCTEIFELPWKYLSSFLKEVDGQSLTVGVGG